MMSLVLRSPSMPDYPVSLLSMSPPPGSRHQTGIDAAALARPLRSVRYIHLDNVPAL